MIGRIIKFGLLIGLFVAVAGVSAYVTLTHFISNESNVIVPDLTGKHVVDALELLSDLSLNTKIKGMEYSTDVPRHHVILQDPAPGSEIKPGRDVRITLSKGRKTIITPALKGLTLNQAQIVIEENGLILGNVARVYQDRTDGEVIVSQAPSPGKTIHREDPVDLLISLGKRPTDFLMPDLSGLSLDEAMSLIEKEHLTLGKVRTASDKDRPVDRIVDQSPLPGYRVFAEDSVDLTINRKTESEKNLIEKRNGLLLFRHRTEPGFLNRHIRVRLNSYGISPDLVDEFVKPGKEIWCFIPSESNTTAFFYEDDQLIKSEVIE